MSLVFNRRSIALAAGISFLALVSMSQVSLSTSGTGRLSVLQSGLAPGWPPHASHMVLLDKKLNGPMSPILPNEFALVYSVPVDKWLVITGKALSITNGETTVCENLAGTLSYRFGTDPLLTSAPLGVTFAPGTSLVIFNGNQVAPVTVNNYSFVGYLVDA